MRDFERNSNIYNVGGESPQEYKQLVEHLIRFRRIYANYQWELSRLIENNYSPTNLIEPINKLINILESLLSEFISVVKIKVSDSELVEELENDTWNYMTFLRVKVDNLFAGPVERVNAFNISNIGQNLISPINMIIFPSLYYSWEKSKRTRPKFQKSIASDRVYQAGTEDYCIEEFYTNEFLNQLKSRAGTFDRILLVLSGGKLGKNTMVQFGRKKKDSNSNKSADEPKDFSDLDSLFESEKEIFGDNSIKSGELDSDETV